MSYFRVGFSLSFFVGFLLVGWWLSRRGILSQPGASRLTQGVIKYPQPLVLCIALWFVNFDTWRLALLPLLGAVISLSALLPAWLYARKAGLNSPRTGSVLTCALFSNLGYLGAFTAFALFGEEAFALCMLYMLFFSPCYYTLGFGIAGHYGHRADRAISRPSLRDDLRLYPVAGMAVGIMLNLANVPRPEAFTTANNILIPVTTALHLIAIGTQVSFRLDRRWLRPSMAMGLIKFLYTPAVAWMLVTLIGLEGLPRLIVLIEASTPVGVSAMLFPLLFGLDRELSNSLWLVMTLIAIPWLLLVIPVLQLL